MYRRFFSICLVITLIVTAACSGGKTERETGDDDSLFLAETDTTLLPDEEETDLPLMPKEGEERVDARSQRDGQRGQKLNIGKRAAVFPLAHGLRAHVEVFCKLLLRHAFGEAQRFDLAADVDVHKGKTPFL